MPYDKNGVWYAGPSNLVEQNAKMQFYPEKGMPMQLNQGQMQERSQNLKAWQGSNPYTTTPTVDTSNNSVVNDINNRGFVGGSNQFANNSDGLAKSITPYTGTYGAQGTGDGKGGKVGGKKVNGAAVAAAAIAGTGAIVNAIDTPTWEPRIGKNIKGAGAHMFGDLSLTSAGTAIAPGWGTLIGFGLDMGKNAFMMSSERDKEKKLYGQYGFNESLKKSQQNQQLNYIGKFGMKSSGSLAEVEANEIAIKLGKDGNYKHVASTGPGARSHEEGGEKWVLEEGTLVFPKKYKGRIERALANGNNKKINQLKEQMLIESTAAALNNEKYSNTAGVETQLNELSKPKDMDDKAKMRYGGKINSNNMKKKNYYNTGGIVGQNPYIDQSIPQGGANPYYSNPQQIPNQIPASKYAEGGMMNAADDDPPENKPAFYSPENRAWFDKQVSNKPGFKDFLSQENIINPYSNVYQGNVQEEVDGRMQGVNYVQDWRERAGGNFEVRNERSRRGFTNPVLGAMGKDIYKPIDVTQNYTRKPDVTFGQRQGGGFNITMNNAGSKGYNPVKEMGLGAKDINLGAEGAYDHLPIPKYKDVTNIYARMSKDDQKDIMKKYRGYTPKPKEKEEVKKEEGIPFILDNEGNIKEVNPYVNPENHKKWEKKRRRGIDTKDRRWFDGKGKLNKK